MSGRSILATILATVVASLVGNTVSAQTPDLYDLNTVREIRLYFQQTNFWTLLQQNYATKTNIEADMKVDGITYRRVGVRFRGNTSYRRLPPGSEKAGFNIRTNVNISGQKLYGYDHLNLNNGFNDPTFMREVITYQICRRYMSTPKANFVKVYLNDQYWGIYINVQQPNSDMVDEWFRSNQGNRYRGFPDRSIGGTFNDSAFNYLGSIAANYKRGYEFKKGDGTDLMQFITVLTQTPLGQLPALLPKVFSVDQGYWYATCMNVLAHTDSYIGTGKDHMEYHDPVHGTIHIFPFDVNESIGGQGGSANLSPYFNSTNPQRPMLSRTLSNSEWRARYDAHYRTVLNESFSWAKIGALVTRYQTMIRADVVADTKKIYPTSAFTSNLTQDYGRGRNRILALRPLIENRERYLRGFASLTAVEAGLSDLGRNPRQPAHNQVVTITVRASGASSVTLYYRAQGPFLAAPMFDDGRHGDGAANDGVYGARIPGHDGGTQIDYYAGAKTTAGVLRFLPRHAEFQSPNYFIDYQRGTSPIVINEALAKNDSVNQDPAGEFDDWLELYNTSNAAVNVGGMYLTDKYDNATKFKLPANTMIPSAGTLLIWCDEDLNQGPLHAPFKISGAGENLYLFATDGKTLVGWLLLGAQVSDISTGRLTDQKPNPLVTFMSPTPNKTNFTGLGGVRSFSALDSTAHTMKLAFGGIPKVGTQFSLDVTSGPTNSLALLMISTGANYFPFLNGTVVLTNGALVQLVLPTNGNGAASASASVPTTPGLPGIPLYLQSFAIDTSGLLAANALEIIVYN